MILDRQLAIEQAGGDENLAKELFAMLIKELPDLFTNIQCSFQLKKNQSLKESAHKIHGATAYCGVPDLQQAAYELENTIKQGDNKEIQSRIDKIEVCIQQLQSTAEIMLEKTWG